MNNIEQSDVATSELNAVLAVARRASFRRAAEDLDLSPSALSHAVASLEQRIGVTLFHRTTRSVSLTEAGVRFVDRVGPAMREISAAVDAARSVSGTPSGTLRFNAARLAVERIFGQVVLPFLAAYPQMKIDITTDGRLVDIVAAGFDAGIRPGDLVPQDMVAVPCSESIRFAVVGTPRYFEQHRAPRSPADLHQHTCIQRRMPSGAPLPWEFGKGREVVTVDVRGALIVDAPELSIAATLRGTGLSWVSVWSVEQQLADGSLVSVLDDWSPPSPGLCLYYPRHAAASAGLRAFVEFLRASGVGKRGTPREHTPEQRKPRSRRRRV